LATGLFRQRNGSGEIQQETRSLSLKIHEFFEYPKTAMAKVVQLIIYVLIVVSTVCAAIQYFNDDLFEKYEQAFMSVEYIALSVFTVEFITKVATAPNKRKYAVRPMTIIDFLAIFPSLAAIVASALFNTSELRAVRLIRLLWLARTLRVFKLLRIEFFSKILHYNNTILQAISPIIVLFVALKGVIWFLEYSNFWFEQMNLAELFAIIGFALGIVLAQKVTSTYEKFYQIEESVVRLAASLSSIASIIDSLKPGEGTRGTYEWGQEFLRALKDSRGTASSMATANQRLYRTIGSIEKQPSEMSVAYMQLVETATFCLNRKKRLTPKPYDSMLQQATVLYLFMLAIFISGWSGMLSVALGTYVLYGMYNLTQDLDSILGGEFRLITIELSELELFVQRVEGQLVSVSPMDAARGLVEGS
jgi:hypothetical protein